jgi:RNA-directed DNA polymerase
MQRLNPLIKGWTTYYRGAVAKKIFTDLDHFVWHCTWRWSLRRHPKKARTWVKGRYFGRFHPDRNDQWVFGDRESGKYLIKFSWTSIQRHIPVKGTASKDDPSLEDYWATRTRKRRHPQADGKINVSLAMRQRGLCPLCGLDLIAGAGYEPESVRAWADWFMAMYRTINRQQLVRQSRDGTAHGSDLMLTHVDCRPKITGEEKREPLGTMPARPLRPA